MPEGRVFHPLAWMLGIMSHCHVSPQYMQQISAFSSSQVKQKVTQGQKHGLNFMDLCLLKLNVILVTCNRSRQKQTE